jgi:hypothetical protein
MPQNVSPGRLPPPNKPRPDACACCEDWITKLPSSLPGVIIRIPLTLSIVSDVNPYQTPKSKVGSEERLYNNGWYFCLWTVVIGGLVPIVHFGVVSALIGKQSGIITSIGDSGNLRSLMRSLGSLTPMLPVTAIIACAFARIRIWRWCGVVAYVIATTVILGTIFYLVYLVAFLTSPPGV